MTVAAKVSGLKKFSAVSVIIVFIFIFIVGGVYTFYSNSVISSDISEQWVENDQALIEKGVLLHRLDYHLGYGGLIHNFKNYVLRGEENLIAEVESDGKQIKEIIATYKTLPLSREEREAIMIVESTVNRYLFNFTRAQELRSTTGIAPDEIDTSVRIDDTPALEALLILETEWELMERNKRATLLELSASNQQVSNLVFASLFVMSGLAIALFWFSLREAKRQVLFTEQARENEKQVSSIIDGTADGIIVIDDKGSIESINPAAADIFGYDEEELIGESVSLLLPPDERGEHDNYVKNSKIHSPRIINQARQLRGYQKDGKEFDMELNVAPIFNQGRKRFVGIFRDISERKQRELIIEKAKNAAEDHSKAKSLFLAQMNHELRTPLNAIMGFAQVIEYVSEKKLDEKQEEYIAHILSSGEHLLHMINDITDISGIESGNVELSLEPVSVSEAVGRAVQYIEGFAEEKKIKIHNEISDDSLVTLVDARRYRQIIINVLSNAVKYNHDGGDLYIRAYMNSGVHLEIEDTGFGISDEMRDRVFTAFDRLDRDAGDVEGTGLGLALSKQLADFMDGDIYFDSEVGKGTTFHVVMPATPLDVTATDQLLEYRKNAPIEVLADKEQQYRILYVEDNILAGKIIEDVLGLIRNVEVDIISTPKECMENVFKIRPDLILMDIDLPEMTGIDLYYRLKGMMADDMPPVVALSSVTDAKRVKEATAAGFKDYLAKPVNIQQLLATLSKQLEKSADA